MVEGRGRVVVPTGIVKLSAPAEWPRARRLIVAKFEDVFAGHHVMPLDTLVLEPGIFPARVEFGLETRICVPVWRSGAAAGRSPDHLRGRWSEGIVPGDQLTLRWLERGPRGTRCRRLTSPRRR
jgi:hypothetical protein